MAIYPWLHKITLRGTFSSSQVCSSKLQERILRKSQVNGSNPISASNVFIMSISPWLHTITLRGTFSSSHISIPFLGSIFFFLSKWLVLVPNEPLDFEQFTFEVSKRTFVSNVFIMSISPWLHNITLRGTFSSSHFGKVENKISGTSRYHFWIAYEKFYRTKLSLFQTNGWILRKSQLKGSKRISGSNVFIMYISLELHNSAVRGTFPSSHFINIQIVARSRGKW